MGEAAEDSGVSLVEDPVHAKTHTLHLQRILVVFAVNTIYFAQLVNIVGAGACGRAITSVVGGATEVVWLTQVITILTVVLSPPVSQAADYWGRKWFLIGLTACGCIGSIVVSRADSIGATIAGFTVGGLSYGAQPLLHAVVSEVLPRKRRPWAQASVNVTAALGAIVGLIMGGALTRNGNADGFRVYWYVTAALYAMAAGICVIFYNPPPRPAQLASTQREKIKGLDWMGYVLLTIGLVLFCLALSWSQNPYSWTDAHVLATFLVGIAFIIALIVFEWFIKSDGMFHHRLFDNRNFAIALGCVFAEGLVFFSANNYFAFEVNTLFTSDPLRVGLVYSVAFYAHGTFAVLAGIYCSWSKSIRLPSVLAFLSFTIFNILMATNTISTPERNIWAYPVFFGMGLGTCLTTLVTAAQFSTPPDLIAITSGLMISVRSLGGSVGLAIFNAIFSGQLGENLGPKVAEAVLPLGLPEESLGPLIGILTSGNPAGLQDLPGVSPEILEAASVAISESYLLGFRYVWVAAGCFSFTAALASYFLYDPRADFNARIDAPVEKETEQPTAQMITRAS